MAAIRCPKSPISIPEGKSGGFSVRHRRILSADLVSAREAYTTGKRMVQVRFAEERVIHELCEESGLWMSDLPIELRQIEEALKLARPFGNVLVGGLGLGLISLMLARRRKVDRVDVVELEHDVIKLCKPDHKKVFVYQGDIYKVLKRMPVWGYDFAFLDTWTDTSEAEWWESVMPLRRLIANKFGPQRVWCWAEDIMLGQIVHTLTVCEPHWKMEKLKMPMARDEALFFVQNVGLPVWERIYGGLIAREGVAA